MDVEPTCRARVYQSLELAAQIREPLAENRGDQAPLACPRACSTVGAKVKSWSTLVTFNEVSSRSLAPTRTSLRPECSLETWAPTRQPMPAESMYGMSDTSMISRLEESAPVSYTHLRAHETDSYLVC